jgi:RHS repeat-associated protein
VSFVKARDGIISYTEYVNGRMTEQIEDVDTSITADFDVSVPSGLSSSGTEFHRTTTYAFDDQGRPDKTTYADGREMKSYYSKLADTRLVSLSYNDYDASPLKFYGPVQYTLSNQGGNAEVQATVALTSNESTTALTGHVDETDADPITAMDLGTVAQMQTSLYNETGTQLQTSRLYFIVPASGSGTDGTNYDATTYTYDDMGHQTKTTEAHGTISKTTYDVMGRVSARWIGTDDGMSSNMVKIEELEYDSASDMGDSLVTKRTLFVEDGTTNKRETTYSHDLRGRVLLETNPEMPHALHKVDNEGRVLATGLFSSTASITVSSDDPTTETSNRWALTQWAFDETGQLWRTKRHKIDSADGSDDDNLEDLSWRDADGLEIKHDGSQLAKTFYDRLGRQTHAFVLAEDNDSAYADVDDVNGDYVLEESQSVYDTNTDEVLMSVQLSREHDDFGGGATTGALDTNADADSLLLTASNVVGRPQITATWYDRFWRTTDTVAYGTYGGSNFDRDGLSVPSRSDTALRTSYSYDTDGTLQDTTDPRALVMRRVYDDAGRVTKEVRNYSASVNSGNPANPDDNQTVTYAYTDGLRVTITADLPSGETDQTTTYTYGTTKGSSGPDSLIATGHLLKTVQYPDSASASWDVVSYAYNAQGEMIWKRDQKHADGDTANVTEYSLDDEGKEEHRRVATLGTGLDGAVRRISTVYNSLGRPSTVTQYDNATVGSGTVKDQTQYTYDGWSNVTKFEIDPDTTVGGGTVPDKEVSYSYAKATTGRNTVRRSDMTLPSGNVITFDYSLNKDGSASRVSKLVDGAVVLSKYDYLGAGHVVGQNYEEISVFSRDYDGSGYSLLDRFDRPIKNAWTSDLSTDRNFYEVDITWDRNSNITRVEDNVHTGFDVAYTIDDLDRLTDAEEGTWSGGAIASRKRHQTWTTLTHTGNWSREKLDLDGDDNWNETNEHDDTRTHNDVNELTLRDPDSNAGTTNYTLTHNALGELTNDGHQYKYQYDAFGRLRKIQNQGDTLVAEYRYNGLGFMIGVHEDTDTDGDADASDKWYYPAYDEAWRMVANFRESDSSPKEEWVSHLAGEDGLGGSSYINGVVLRDKDADTDWVNQSDGTLEQRVYLCQNWRGDVSALVKTGKLLLEWDKYSAYGIPFGLPGADTDSDGDCDGSGAGTDIAAIQGLIDISSYGVRADVDLDGDVDATDKTTAQNQMQGIALGWSELSSDRHSLGHQGSPQLVSAALINLRHRVLDTRLGTWLRRDPLPTIAPTDLYEAYQSNPTSTTDPSGLYSQRQREEFWPPRPDPEYPGCVFWLWGDCCFDPDLMRTIAAENGGMPRGSTHCCNGTVVTCNYFGAGMFKPNSYEPTAFAAISHCVDVHEAVHANNVARGNSCPQNASRIGGVMYSPPNSVYNQATNETMAYLASLDCLGEVDCSAAANPIACQLDIKDAIESRCDLLNYYSGGQVGHTQCWRLVSMPNATLQWKQYPYQ